MPINIEQLQGFLVSNDLNYDYDEESESIVTGFATQHYVNEKGDQGILIVAHTQEEGRYLELFTPRLYMIKDNPNKQAFLQSLLMISFKTKAVQFEYDDGDGEVRACIETPVEDSHITERQFMRMLHTLAAVVDQFDSSLRSTLKTGKIVLPGLPASMEQMMELMKLVEDAGGIDALKKKMGLGEPDELTEPNGLIDPDA